MIPVEAHTVLNKEWMESMTQLDHAMEGDDMSFALLFLSGIVFSFFFSGKGVLGWGYGSLFCFVILETCGLNV